MENVSLHNRKNQQRIKEHFIYTSAFINIPQGKTTSHQLSFTATHLSWKKYTFYECQHVLLIVPENMLGLVEKTNYGLH